MNHLNHFTLAFALALGTAPLALIGCSEAADEVTNTIDCHSVCERYSECFNADYDVSACTDKCEDRADADADRQAALRKCDDCIDDKSCASATFNCGDECVGIVP